MQKINYLDLMSQNFEYLQIFLLMKVNPKKQVIELDSRVCRDNVFLLEALELKAASIEEGLYNTINTPENINPIKTMMKEIDEIALKLSPIYKELELQRMYNFWKKLIKSMGGLNIQLIRIIESRKMNPIQNTSILLNSILETSMKQHPSKPGSSEKNKESNKEKQEKQAKKRKLRGVCLFNQNYTRGVEKKENNNIVVQIPKQQENLQNIDFQIFRKKILENVLSQFKSVDSRTFTQEADEMSIEMDHLKKKMQTFNHVPHVEDLQDILDFFKKTHFQTLEFLKKTSLSGDISKFQLKIQKIMDKLKDMREAFNSKAIIQFQSILLSLKSRENSISKVIESKLQNLQKQIQFSKCEKADKGVDTNIKEIRKIKQLEKVAEEKKEYWENSYKNSIQSYERLAEEMEGERSALKKQVIVLKHQVQKAEQKKKELKEVNEALMKKITNLSEMKKMKDTKVTQDKDVQADLDEDEGQIRDMRKKNSRNSVYLVYDSSTSKLKKRTYSCLGDQFSEDIKNFLQNQASEIFVNKENEKTEKSNSQKEIFHHDESQEINEDLLHNDSKRATIGNQKIRLNVPSEKSQSGKKMITTEKSFTKTMRSDKKAKTNDIKDQKFLKPMNSKRVFEQQFSLTLSISNQVSGGRRIDNELLQRLNDRQRTKTTVKDLYHGGKFKNLDDDALDFNNQIDEKGFPKDGEEELRKTRTGFKKRNQHQKNNQKIGRESLIDKYYKRKQQYKDKEINSLSCLDKLSDKGFRKKTDDLDFQLHGSQLPKNRKRLDNEAKSLAEIRRKKDELKKRKRETQHAMLFKKKNDIFDFKKKKKNGESNRLQKFSFMSLHNKKDKKGQNLALLPFIFKKPLQERRD